MPKKYTITYHEVHSPIAEPVTKFGGQPVWVAEPQWPVSRLYGMPMQFICQIALPAELFGDIEARMAYLFMADWDGESVFPDTFDPDKGENAVILQPRGTWDGPSLPLREGPCLYRRVCRDSVWEDVPCEVAVELQRGDDPELGAWDDVDPNDEQAWNAYFAALIEDKIGGTPVPTSFGKEVIAPWRDGWRLLLQLSADDGPDAPFFLGFAWDGVGYAFISADGRVGKFLWDR